MRISEYALVVSLVCGTVYNVDNSLLRVTLILLWGAIPLFFLFSYKKITLLDLGLREIANALFILFLLFLSWLMNVDSLSFELSGPNVEKMTPFLYIFYLLCMLLFLQLNKCEISPSFLTIFMFIVTAILFLDVIFRYVQAPSFFMNYNTRHQAKTIGFFATTNVNGQIISFLIVLTWFLRFRFRMLIQVLLLGILITTMARSAIVALILAYGAYYVVYKTGLLSRLLSFIVILGILSLLIIDPMNFKNDGSFLSKLQFFMATYDLILLGSATDIIFGFGASYDAITQALNVNGWSPHVAVLKAFLYYGIIGVFIFCSILIHFYRINHKMLIPIFTYLVFSMAGAPIFWPTISVGLILLLVYDNVEQSKMIRGYE